MPNDPGSGTRPYNAQSLERGLLILGLLRDSPAGDLGVSDVAAGIGLHKSTVHRLLTTLVKQGFVVQDATTKRYRLGLAFLEFAHHVVDRLEVRRHALRAMHALADETGESVYLNVLAGRGALTIDEVVGPRGVTLGSNVGVVLPLHAVATGKCFLAWLPARERDALLPDGALEAVTEHTQTDRGQLLAELERVRRLGYATNDEETEPGVRYAAAPIFDRDGRIVAAVSVGAPVLRTTAADLARLGARVAAAALRISTSLGYPGDARPVNGRIPVRARS